MSKSWTHYYIGFFSIFSSALFAAHAPAPANAPTNPAPHASAPPSSASSPMPHAPSRLMQPSFYPNPGIVAPRGDRWVGSDHLYNLSNKIGIHVEINKPQSLSLPFTSESLEQIVGEAFKKAGIFQLKNLDSALPPLPAFHFLIMIQKVDKGYAVFCTGRLFESITVERINLSEQTYMQAITWESQNLTIAPTEDIQSEVRKSVMEIAQTFIERYQFFKNIKTEIRKD